VERRQDEENKRKESKSALSKRAKGFGISVGHAPPRRILDEDIPKNAELSGDDEEKDGEPTVHKNTFKKFDYREADGPVEEVQFEAKASKKLKPQKKAEPMTRIMSRLGERVTELKDAFDRQAAGHDGVPPSELMKLFWSVVSTMPPTPWKHS